MRTLLIDNYDSFTYNLFQYLAEICRVPPLVVRNDAASWRQLRHLEFDNIVISPGPGRPEKEGDFGVCRDAILQATVPVLGVCLGHQGLCHYLGGRVDYARTAMHGRLSRVRHTGQDIFSGIPSPFSVVRYHSLHVTSLPEDLEAIAWTEDDVLMGVRHRSRPIWGVQFHPESICTEYGHKLLENFVNLTNDHMRGNPPRRRVTDSDVSQSGIRPALIPFAEPVPNIIHQGRGQLQGKPLRLFYRRLPERLDAERVYLNLYAGSRPSFWLDSAQVRNFSRFSYMGDAAGPLAEVVRFRVATGEVQITRGSEVQTRREPLLDYLDRTLQERRLESEGLPFDFAGGYVGYLGYELKAESGGSAVHASPDPDAGLIFADRFIAFDHEEGMVYLACVDTEDNAARAAEWIRSTGDVLAALKPSAPWQRSASGRPVEFRFRHASADYLKLIDDCEEQIRRGETYEVCLTNMISADVKIDPLNTYRCLRQNNPAPYATFLDFGDVAVMSASPERFLAIDPYGVVSSKPIKGTRPRGADIETDERLYDDLRTNEKDRAENLMIVDLVRNDLGTVCNYGSVHVSNIFTVESYASVHQLISQIRGRLRRGMSAIQAVRAAFPPGSMTGAPKKRTMEIIDRMEAGPRGIYSGSIGFLSLNGSVDLSVVIRTIVVGAAGVTIGVGGAIIAMSDPQAELEEVMVKARASLRALAETAQPFAPTEGAA